MSTSTPCDHCSATYRPSQDPDPCLGHRPGIAHACCGHSHPETAYLVYGQPNQPSNGRDTLALRGALARAQLGLPSLRQPVDHHDALDIIEWAHDNSRDNPQCQRQRPQRTGNETQGGTASFC